MKQRLVIADDEADIRRLLMFLLRSYELFEACDGTQALDMIREVQPDLALLDILMPGMTGVEVAAALRRDPLTATLPIILLSAKGQMSDSEIGLEVGPIRYMVKPFEPSALRACVAEVLQDAPPARAER